MYKITSDMPEYATIVELIKYHKDCAMNYVMAQDGTPNRIYNFHWSMIRLLNTLLDRPYSRTLTENNLTVRFVLNGKVTIRNKR